MPTVRLFANNIFMSDFFASLTSTTSPSKLLYNPLKDTNNVIISLVAKIKAIEEKIMKQEAGLASMVVTVGLFLTVTLEASGKCSTSLFDFASSGIVVCKTSFAGTG